MRIFSPVFFALILCFLIIGNAGAQYIEQPDYSLFQSRVIPPPNFSPSPENTESQIVISADGFDNIYLGNDFGEPHIAVNPKDFKNSATAYNINNYYYTLNGTDWIKKAVSFPGSSAIGDPVLAYDSLGNLYYLQMYQIGSLYGGWVAKSTDKGIFIQRRTR
jgi:hypothetical protein